MTSETPVYCIASANWIWGPETTMGHVLDQSICNLGWQILCRRLTVIRHSDLTGIMFWLQGFIPKWTNLSNLTHSHLGAKMDFMWFQDQSSRSFDSFSGRDSESSPIPQFYGSMSLNMWFHPQSKVMFSGGCEKMKGGGITRHYKPWMATIDHFYPLLAIITPLRLAYWDFINTKYISY
jgi:hypothetical protein